MKVIISTPKINPVEVLWIFPEYLTNSLCCLMVVVCWRVGGGGVRITINGPVTH